MDLIAYSVSAVSTIAIVLAGQQLLLFDCRILSLGTASFFACGAYLAALLAKNLLYPPLVSTLLASITVTVLALAVGYLWLRTLRSDFFAVATLALAQTTVVVLRALGPGGLAGMGGIPPFHTPFQNVLNPTLATMVIYLFTAGLILTAVTILRSRRIGAVAVAVGADENAAAARGFRPEFVKLQMFLLSAFLAGLGGAMQAHLLGVVEPRMASIDMTVLLLVGTIISGRGATWGCVFGATFVVLGPELLQRVFSAEAEPQWRWFLLSRAAYGAIIIAFVLILPRIPHLAGLRQKRA